MTEDTQMRLWIVITLGLSIAIIVLVLLAGRSAAGTEALPRPCADEVCGWPMCVAGPETQPRRMTPNGEGQNLYRS